MSVNLVVNNNSFAYPTDGQEPGWGGPGTAWAVEVTSVLSSLQGSNDVPQTTAAIANNTVSPANVTNLSFSTSTVRSAFVEYSIYIFSSTTELAEVGLLELVYKNGATVGTKWSLSQASSGDDSGVRFSVTDLGQVQYTSLNVSGTSYSGTLKFSAKTTAQ